MKKLLWILTVSLTILACGDRSERTETQEAAADEDVEAGSGAEISPQLELDSADSRFEVDTISTPAEADKEAEEDDF